MHDPEPQPCTPAGFLVFSSSGEATCGALRSPGALACQCLKVPLPFRWGGSALAWLSLLVVLVPCPRLVLLLVFVDFAGCALFMLVLRDAHAEFELFPSGNLTVTFRGLLGARTRTMSASSVLAVAFVEHPHGEGSTWRWKVLLRDRAPLDLDVESNHAQDVAEFLRVPLERHPDGAAPYILAAASATLAADA